MINNITVTNYE